MGFNLIGKLGRDPRGHVSEIFVFVIKGVRIVSCP